MSIKKRLLIILLTFCLAPALFIGALFYKNSARLIQDGVISKLISLAGAKEAELLEFLYDKRGRVEDYSKDLFISRSLARIRSTRDAGSRSLEETELSKYLSGLKEADPDLLEMHVLDTSGSIVASTDRAYMGMDKSQEPYFVKGLRDSYIQDIFSHRHARVMHTIISVSAPIKGQKGPVGVMMAGYDPDILTDILSGRRAGELGAGPRLVIEPAYAIDIFLVNERGMLITPSVKDAPSPLKTLPVKRCGDDGVGMSGQWQDALGTTVLGASACLSIKNGPQWAIVVEEDKSAALSPIYDLRYALLLIGASLTIVVVFTSLAISLSISRPIDRLKRGTERIATGDLGFRVGTTEPDEIGSLSRAFDSMVENLKKVTASRDELAMAQEALRASEEKYKSLVDGAPVGVYASDVEGRFIYLNRTFAAIFGFDNVEEAAAKGSPARYKDPQDRKRLMDVLFEKGKAEGFEVQGITKDGEVKDLLISASLSDGLVTGMVMDVTEKKRAGEIRKEAAHSRALAEVSGMLADSAMDYGAVLETIARYVGDNVGVLCVISLVSEDLDLLEPAAVHHRNPQKAEAARKGVSELHRAVDALAKSVKEGKQLLIESPDDMEGAAPALMTELESAGIHHALITPLRAFGKVTGVISVFRDRRMEAFTPNEAVFMKDMADRAALAIANARLFMEAQAELELRRKAETEIKKYASELEKSNEDLQRFAYIASHDLREPLRMVSSFVQLLKKQYEQRLDEKADQYIGFAVDGAERMRKMIDDLLEFSRVQTKGRPFEDTDMEAALGLAKQNLQVALWESGAVITSEKLPKVSADPVQMMQVFQNLISNAIKFRRGERPGISIKASERDRDWVFSVKDNGLGIGPDDRERIFDLFQRVHGKEYPGTGLGLAICKRIVERHGGSIWVESEPGKGSTFFFTIPKKLAGR